MVWNASDNVGFVKLLQDSLWQDMVTSIPSICPRSLLAIQPFAISINKM